MSYSPIRSFFQARDPSVDRKYRPRPLRKVKLIDLVAEEDEDSWSDEHSENETEATQSTYSSASNSTLNDCALVYLRLRPNDGETPSIYVSNGNVLVTKKYVEKGSKPLMEKHFKFTGIIDGTVQQSTVYDTCIRQSIEAEENLTILTYGTSGSGKTYTQIGDAENPGLIPRALEQIFSFYQGKVRETPCLKIVNSTMTFLDNTEIEEQQQLRRKVLLSSIQDSENHKRLSNLVANEHQFDASSEDGKTVFVWISFTEIYNEIVYDLLNPNYDQKLSKKKGLTIVSNKGQVFIKNLTSILVRNSFEAQLLLSMGTRRITFGSTAVNNHSSRSHFVFFIDVITVSHPDIVAFHSYRFCDLAGSERLNKTKNIGNCLKEAQRINASLLVLGRCLDAVYHNQRKKTAHVVPYRDSKLTTLLQAPLMGKEKLTMIVNINPSEAFFEENLHVLNFASIANNIVFKEKPKKEVKRSRFSWLASNQPFNSALFNEYDSQRDVVTMLIEKNETLNALLEKQSSNELETKKFLINEYEDRIKRLDENWKMRMDLEINYYKERIRLLQEQLEKKSSHEVYVADSESDAELVCDSDSDSE